ncbi:MAG: hypothetical protein LBJ02_05760 [Bifidobacteriaceae bacterium]|jgi:hypothetical protein|nr:hypothetical protein [Bifidobacteriaceae bacterium]
MSDKRFLLGYGERLTDPVAAPGGGGGPEEPYTLGESFGRLSPMLAGAAQALDALPSLACPLDHTVIEVTLHPQWVAKSYHPQQLIRQWRLRQVGSRPVSVRPERWTRQSDPVLSPSARLFLAGRRTDLRAWSSAMTARVPDMDNQVRRIESISAPLPQERLRTGGRTSGTGIAEIVLHASADKEDDFIVQGFEAFAQSLGYEPVMDCLFQGL